MALFIIFCENYVYYWLTVTAVILVLMTMLYKQPNRALQVTAAGLSVVLTILLFVSLIAFFVKATL